MSAPKQAMLYRMVMPGHFFEFADALVLRSEGLANAGMPSQFCIVLLQPAVDVKSMPLQTWLTLRFCFQIILATCSL